jgi:hypothetical protein
MIWPFAVPMPGTIESDGLVAGSKWAVQPGPVLTGTRIAMDQNHRLAGTFNHDMQARAFNADKF